LGVDGAVRVAVSVFAGSVFTGVRDDGPVDKVDEEVEGRAGLVFGEVVEDVAADHFPAWVAEAFEGLELLAMLSVLRSSFIQLAVTERKE